jgi:hypothetical protein
MFTTMLRYSTTRLRHCTTRLRYCTRLNLGILLEEQDDQRERETSE